DHERRQLSAQAIRRQPPSCHLDERGGAKPGQRRNGQSSRCPCSRSGLSLNHPTKSHRPLARYGAFEKRASRAAYTEPSLACFYSAPVAWFCSAVDTPGEPWGIEHAFEVRYTSHSGEKADSS